jgi:hypothetical protein
MMRTLLEEIFKETDRGLAGETPRSTSNRRRTNGDLEDNALGLEFEMEAESSDLPAPVREALSYALWHLAVQRAVDAGITDVNKLTNMIFFAAHPERAGRKISKSESNFGQLRDEWLGYKDFFVLPILKEAAANVGRTKTSFKPIAVESRGGGRVKDKREPKRSDRVTIRGYRGKNIILHRHAAAALQAMIHAARADGIMAPLLEAVSGYRSVARQKRLWEIGLEKYGSAREARKWIAPPGRSAHHSGRAIDLWLGLGIGKRNAKAMVSLPVYKWLQINAELFGFYPYTREPWHWEYNPPPAHLELELVGDLDDDLFAGSEFRDDYDDEFDFFDIGDQDNEGLLSEASGC